MFASYVIYSIKQTDYPKSKYNYMFASYVIYSIKQTELKQIALSGCLLVMLFIVLSKPLLK